MKIDKWDALISLVKGYPVTKDNKKYNLEKTILYSTDLETGEVQQCTFRMNDMSLREYSVETFAADTFYLARLKDFQNKRLTKEFSLRHSGTRCTFYNDSVINLVTKEPVELTGLEILGIFDREVEIDISSELEPNIFIYINKNTGKVIEKLDSSKLEYTSFPIAEHGTKVLIPNINFKSIIYVLHILGFTPPDFIDSELLKLYLKGKDISNINCRTTDWITNITKKIVFLQDLVNSIKPQCRAEILTAYLILFKFM